MRLTPNSFRKNRSNDFGSILALTREIAYCLQENVHNLLHKTPHGVCRIEQGRKKIDAIKANF
jgi:hypothetical protein